MTQADGTASTLKAVLFVVKGNQNMATAKLGFKVSTWKYHIVLLLMFLWQNQVLQLRLLPMGQGSKSSPRKGI